MDQSWAAAYSNAHHHPRRASGGGIKGYAPGGGTTSNSGNAPGTLFGYSPQFSNLLGSMMGYQGFPSIAQTTAPTTAPQYQALIPASANIAVPQIGASSLNLSAAPPPQIGASSPPPVVPTFGQFSQLPQSSFAQFTPPEASPNNIGYAAYAPAVGTQAGYVAPPAPVPTPAASAPVASSGPYGTDPNIISSIGQTGAPTYNLNTPQGQAAADQAAFQMANGQKRGGGIKGYDTGGLAPGTTNPTTPEAANPAISQQVQQYAAMAPEQLQQLAVMFGNTPRGQIINRVLQQKHMMPGSLSKPATPAPAPMLNPSGMAEGGRHEAHFDDGGAVGYLHGATPGRTDVLHIQPPGGSYVIPADVVSGLGEGNSIAGAAILNRAFGMGPWGTDQPKGRSGSGVPIPRPPPTYGQFQKEFYASLPSATVGAKRGGHFDNGGDIGPADAWTSIANDKRIWMEDNPGQGEPHPQDMQPYTNITSKLRSELNRQGFRGFARGGKSEKGVGQPTPIIAASGEFIIEPRVVRAIGGGDIKRGHETLDHWIIAKRKEIIEKTKNLKPPKK